MPQTLREQIEEVQRQLNDNSALLTKDTSYEDGLPIMQRHQELLNERSRLVKEYEKIHADDWRKKRHEILTRDNYRCCLCKEGEAKIDVALLELIPKQHHWWYDNDFYITRCKHCAAIIDRLIVLGLNFPTAVIKSNDNGRLILTAITTQLPNRIYYKLYIGEWRDNSLYDVIILSEEQVEDFLKLATRFNSGL